MILTGSWYASILQGMPARKNTGIALLPALLDQLNELARADDQGRTRNQLIEEACRQFIPRERRRRRSLGEFPATVKGQESRTPLESGDTNFSGQGS